MRNNGHASLDGLLDALAERAGARKSSRHEDSILGLHEKLDHIAAEMDRLAESVERSQVGDAVEPRLLSRAKTARYTGTSVSQIDRLRRLGRLRATVIESKPLYDLADINAFIESSKDKPQSHGAAAER